MTLTTVGEADLLGTMARQATAREEALAAWGELFTRHRRYLFVVVSRAYGSFLGEEGVVDLVSDTFRRAYDWAGRQGDASAVHDRFTAPDPDSTRRLVLGWLGAIAEGLFRDRFRERVRESARLEQYTEDWNAAREAPEGPHHSSAHQALQEALATLSPSEADALRISLPWYDIDTRSFNVPKGEAVRLAEQLGITPDALRQRRHRAIKRLEAHMQADGARDLHQEDQS